MAQDARVLNVVDHLIWGAEHPDDPRRAEDGVTPSARITVDVDGHAYVDLNGDTPYPDGAGGPTESVAGLYMDAGQLRELASAAERAATAVEALALHRRGR